MYRFIPVVIAHPRKETIRMCPTSPDMQIKFNVAI